MFKLFKNKKKSKKDKELSAQQSQQQHEISKENNKENSHTSKQSQVTPTKVTPLLTQSKEPLIEQHKQQQQELNVQIDNHHNEHSHKDQHQPLKQQPSTNVTHTTSQSCQASPSAFTNEESMHESMCFHRSHLRESQMSNTFSGDALNRFLTSGYLNGNDYDMGYMKRGTIDAKTPTSPHFHRPPNFSYSNPPNVLNLSSTSKKGTLSSINTSTIRKSTRNYSTSPTRVVDELSEEPIRLSKYSGGYVPDPQTPKKIETLDWPSPPYTIAIPELRTRSRSTSNRQNANKTQSTQANVYCNDIELNLTNTSATNKSIRTINKFNRKIYDNEYDDYLRFKRNKPDDNYELRDDINDEERKDVDDVNEMNENDESLKKKLKELEAQSSLAKELLEEMDRIEKISIERNKRRISLDPVKSARDPSAKHELAKTRFSTMSTSSSPSRAICCRSKCLCNQSNVPSTTGGDSLLCSTPKFKQQQNKKTIPKPGYGLLNPKSVTLPCSTRYIGLSSHKSVDFEDSPNSLNYNQNGDSLLFNGNDDKNNYVINSCVDAHATRSTPNLIGTPKIYSYYELKLGLKKKLPIDVDRARLERHLSSEELMKLFGVMTLEQFYEIPEWKRIELKKKAKLF